jgi:uncharacterized protein
VLAEPRYVGAAARAAAFASRELHRGGRLLRSISGGRAGAPGFLEDHTFLAQGFLDLYEATFDVRWLREALALSEVVEQRFADREGGAWFRTAEDHERLLAREKPTHDGAEPSGSSVATLNALRLASFTGDDRWRVAADRALRAYGGTLAQQPVALAEMLLALDFRTDAAREVVLVWPEGQPAPAPLLEVVRATFLPNRALAGAPEGKALEALAQVAAIARDKRALGGEPTAYVCEHGRCDLPAREAERLRIQLAAVRPLR